MSTKEMVVVHVRLSSPVGASSCWEVTYCEPPRGQMVQKTKPLVIAKINDFGSVEILKTDRKSVLNTEGGPCVDAPQIFG